MTILDTQGVHGTAVAKISAEQMTDKLLTLDTVRERLAMTEPVSGIGFPVSERIGFRLETGYNYAFETTQGDELVEAFVSVGDNEYQMSKDALLEATSLCGLPQAYVSKTPARLISPHLNFWYKGGMDTNKEYKALIVKDKCLAVTRGSINPFSNLKLVEEALTAIENKYGQGNVFVDPKFQHSLRQTHMRLIVPEYMRVIADSGTDDDTWSVGVQIVNSLIGQSQTAIDGYLFRWWCTNGAIDVKNNSERWSRKSGGQDEGDVMEWARTAVDSVLGGLETTLDKVQEMVNVEIEGEVNDVLREVFDLYRVPGQSRLQIIENMAEEPHLTMYTVMQAITAAANGPDVDPAHVITLMEAGGSIPHLVSDRCKSCHRFQAKGHTH